MKDELITFETAVLAKEKGFEEPTDEYYNLDGELVADYRENWPINYCKDFDPLGSNAPTQSLLQRWLREKYDTHIKIYPEAMSSDKFYILYKGWILRNVKGVYQYVSGEDNLPLMLVGKSFSATLEIGLQKSLKLIKI
jgi:hypothetical protein